MIDIKVGSNNNNVLIRGVQNVVLNFGLSSVKTCYDLAHYLIFKLKVDQVYLIMSAHH